MMVVGISIVIDYKACRTLSHVQQFLLFVRHMFAAALLIHIDPGDPYYKDMSITQLSAVLCVPEKLIRYKFNLEA